MTNEAPARRFITVSGTALVIADLLSEEAATAFIDTMPREDVPTFYNRSKTIARAIAFVGKAAKRRIIGEQIFAIGQTWTDPDTNEERVWTGEESDWKVADPGGLRHALIHVKREHLCETKLGDKCESAPCLCKCASCAGAEAMLTDLEIAMCLETTYKPNHTYLNKAAKRDVRLAEVIADFRTKDTTAPDLREKGKK